MQLVHRALRNLNPDTASVSAVARRYGFRGLGRFAANYRVLFGEPPSTTLRRSLHPGTAHLVLLGRAAPCEPFAKCAAVLDQQKSER
jgi:AraC-like DNA-binding protein